MLMYHLPTNVALFATLMMFFRASECVASYKTNAVEVRRSGEQLEI